MKTRIIILIYFLITLTPFIITGSIYYVAKCQTVQEDSLGRDRGGLRDLPGFHLPDLIQYIEPNLLGFLKMYGNLCYSDSTYIRTTYTYMVLNIGSPKYDTSYIITDKPDTSVNLQLVYKKNYYKHKKGTFEGFIEFVRTYRSH